MTTQVSTNHVDSLELLEIWRNPAFKVSRQESWEIRLLHGRHGEDTTDRQYEKP
jgi:hypothetical protein